jgi:hypothetical protein
MWKRKKSYNRLYLDILKTARKKIEGGLSYNELISELTKRGYNIENGCIEKAVKHWFVDSFAHYDDTENGIILIEMDTSELENHKDCNCILTGKACLALLEYQNVKFTLIATIIAVIIASASLLFGLWGKINFCELLIKIQNIW